MVNKNKVKFSCFVLVFSVVLCGCTPFSIIRQADRNGDGTDEWSRVMGWAEEDEYADLTNEDLGLPTVDDYNPGLNKNRAKTWDWDAVEEDYNFLEGVGGMSESANARTLGSADELYSDVADQILQNNMGDISAEDSVNEQYTVSTTPEENEDIALSLELGAGTAGYFQSITSEAASDVYVGIVSNKGVFPQSGNGGANYYSNISTSSGRPHSTWDVEFGTTKNSKMANILASVYFSCYAQQLSGGRLPNMITNGNGQNRPWNNVLGYLESAGVIDHQGGFNVAFGVSNGINNYLNTYKNAKISENLKQFFGNAGLSNRKGETVTAIDGDLKTLFTDFVATNDRDEYKFSWNPLVSRTFGVNAASGTSSRADHIGVIKNASGAGVVQMYGYIPNLVKYMAEDIKKMGSSVNNTKTYNLVYNTILSTGLQQLGVSNLVKMHERFNSGNLHVYITGGYKGVTDDRTLILMFIVVSDDDVIGNNQLAKNNAREKMISKFCNWFNAYVSTFGS